MASIRRRGRASFPLLFVAGIAAVLGGVEACSFNWEDYDPRLASASSTGVTGPGTGGGAGASGTGTGGAGGMGASGTGGMGAGGASPTGFRLQYKNGNTKGDDIQIQPHFKIVNETQESVPLSDLKIRYWFTKDGGMNFIYDCDFAQFNCIYTAGMVGATSGLKADMYLEISFLPDAGVVAAGGDSGEIQARLHTQNFTIVNQTGDYSFDPTKTSYTDWMNVTLYSKGVLVWGNEP